MGLVLISVIIKANSKEIGYLEIVNVTRTDSELADYSVKLAIERGDSVGVYWRNIYGFPRKKYNAMALVSQALSTLTEKEFELDRDFAPDQDEAPVSPDMERRLHPALRALQAGISRLHHH